MKINWDDYVTLKECAELTGLHYNTVYHYVSVGIIPAKRFRNRFWRVHQRYITEIIDGKIDVYGSWTKDVKKNVKALRDRVKRKTGE